MNNNLTVNERATLAQGLVNDISSGDRGFFYYVGIGKNTPWLANDTFVPNTTNQTTDSINQLYKQLVALKQINEADVSLVVRRNDWSPIPYTAYSNSLPMFTTTLTTNVNGTVTIINSVTPNTNIIIDDVFTVAVANQNTFTLSTDATGPDYVIVSINGLVQTPLVDFDISNNNILILSANAVMGDIIEAKIFATTFSTIIIDDVFKSTPNQNTFLLTTNTTTDLVVLSVNGLVQTPLVDYTIAGNNILTLIANTSANDIVEAKIFESVISNTIASNNGTTVVGTGTTFLLDFSNNDIIQLAGDGITVFPQQREVITITSNNIMTVNLAFSGNVIANTPQLVSNTYPNYAYNFYTRNTYDQVFICLGNNSGAVSTVMPLISVGGDLPSDSYIETSDGYFWKYLYTMSAGAKQLFLTPDWMPVSIDAAVLEAAVPGRLDVINIEDGGFGYNNSSATFNAPIIVVTGDGTGANLTAQVDANGVITGINVLDGGEGYTTANIIANTGITGVNANLQAVIGPPGGWGANNYLQLGCTTAMVSITLTDTEGGTIPTVDVLGDFFQYRQISIIKNPILSSNGGVAQSLNYDMTTTLPLSGNTAYAMNDILYQSSNGSFAAASFYGTIVYFDISTFNLHINNLFGDFVPGQPLYSLNTALTAITFDSVSPAVTVGSGSVEYVENRLPIERSPGQTENLKIIIGF